MSKCSSRLKQALVRAGALIFALLAAPGAQAGGGSYVVCESIRGFYVMDGGDLWRRQKPRSSEGAKVVKYKLLKKTVIRATKGYCLSDSHAGQKFGFESEVSVITIEILRKGEAQKIELLCESGSDGVPAMATCAKDVVTEQTGLHAR
ncbi:MAG: hypothetical protein MRY74_02545 [Neomegalonema sp.]|nr:hypothetical protein [Neomegalonema sp.]